MKNLCALDFENTRLLDKIKDTIQYEFSIIQREINTTINEFTSNLEFEKSLDNKPEEKLLIKKIDELKIYINHLNKSCNSLFHVLKNFK